MYEVQYAPKAQAALRLLARKDPSSVQRIARKIRWLAENASNIAHQPIEGSPFFSLHSGSFRIPYLLIPARQLVIIDDIAQHDKAYKRINKL
jgi:mRNA-degrading endonuclease RelE of RelBE toxin-antitoxin system